MAFNSTRRDAVKTYIDENLCKDRYICDSVKTIADTEMQKTTITAVQVADAVYDYLYENNLGNSVMSAMCNGICTKGEILMLRSNIIQLLL